MKEPDADTAAYAWKLRVKSKLGRGLIAEEQKFLEKVYKDFPEWYTSLTDLVFEATKPFGAQ